jgi:hypothetical protein
MRYNSCVRCLLAGLAKVVMPCYSVVQKCFQANSGSVHQNKNFTKRTVHKCFEGETDLSLLQEGWLERNTHEVLACTLEDV